jgi:hypothetical protein
MPFQGRIGMMPILNFGANSPTVTKLALKANIDLRVRHPHSRFEQITPSVLTSMAFAMLSMLAVTFAAICYGYVRLPLIWWLPASLTLAMLFVTQGSRYETALWYPYDLPHDALFGISCLFLLEGAWLPAFLLYLVDLPVRETSLFLVAILFVSAWSRGQRKVAILGSSLMALLWLGLHAYVAHRFAANATEQRGALGGLSKTLLNPIHWPQIASAFGFLLVPLYMARRRLSKVQLAFLRGAAPCLLVTLAFGVWQETRIFNEWTLPFAVLISMELGHYISHLDSPAFVQPAVGWNT